VTSALNPFILGYVSVLGLNPAGIFLAMGLTNVVLGMIYKLPLPAEAKKVIGTIALEEKWRPEQVYMSGILTGVIWLFLGPSGLVKRLARITPVVVVRGIQFGLMLILLKQAILLMKTSALLSLMSIALIVLLMRNRFLPSAIAVFALDWPSLSHRPLS